MSDVSAVVERNAATLLRIVRQLAKPGDEHTWAAAMRQAAEQLSPRPVRQLVVDGRDICAGDKPADPLRDQTTLLDSVVGVAAAMYGDHGGPSDPFVVADRLRRLASSLEAQAIAEAAANGEPYALKGVGLRSAHPWIFRDRSSGDG